MPAKRQTATFVIAGLISALLFGAATPASKVLLAGIHAQVLAGLLYLGAALGVLPVIVREAIFQWPWRAGRPTFLLLTGAIVFGGILGPLLLMLGLKAASSGSVSLWLNLEFVATVFLGHFVFREHLALRGWIAAAGTLIAAVLLAGVEAGGGFLPVVLIASGCLCWGFDNHFTALIDGISPAQTTFWKGVVAGLCNLLVGSVAVGGVGRPVGVLLALLVGVVSYGLSITLYVFAAQGLGATRSQMVFSAAPFFGLLLSVTALGETFTGAQAVAAGIMVISLVVLFSEKHAHVHRHDAMTHQHRHRHDGGHHDHAHEKAGAAMSHAHRHKHAPQEHAHGHWPDLHHRHAHDNDDEPPPSDD
ncbi:MAG: DMT family transporter [Desulfobacterales bacterium]|jgi:drug/metabolite transporter (DMT)-like permease